MEHVIQVHTLVSAYHRLIVLLAFSRLLALFLAFLVLDNLFSPDRLALGVPSRRGSGNFAFNRIQFF
jgi:hypothetical protein